MLIYAPSLAGDFVYEDARADGTATPMPLLGARRVLEPRWLTNASFAWTTALWDAGPRAARTVSLAWHLLNGLLLWAVARRVVTEAAAVVAVGLYLLHPLQIEAVAAVAYRSELVVASALLLALWCADRGWLIPAFLCALGAVLGKPIGVMAVALVPIWLTWHRSPRWTETARVYWLAASFPVLLLVLDQARIWAWATPETVGRTVAAAVALTARVLVPVRLSIEYDAGAWSPVLIAALLILLAAAIETAWRRGWRPALLVAAWIGASLLPRIVWQIGDGLHDHYLYVPMLALSVAGASVLFPHTEIA